MGCDGGDEKTVAAVKYKVPNANSIAKPVDCVSSSSPTRTGLNRSGGARWSRFESLPRFRGLLWPASVVHVRGPSSILPASLPKLLSIFDESSPNRQHYSAPTPQHVASESRPSSL
ncbi:hypothetical protein DY000_02052261 [Brassica cretica]|uniref:Uncharacterized protein n=1 Tax=Brassica cretica TaxID=69181 RepID=A0ABQ7ADW3_BRACR|nr:hypothetical protein DY000_02052261 [Brassica cretica]